MNANGGKTQREPSRLSIGSLIIIWCPKTTAAPATDAQLTVWYGNAGSFSVRFGRKGRRLFNELNQGTDGIPREFSYLFGKRITVIKHIKPREVKPQEVKTGGVKK